MNYVLYYAELELEEKLRSIGFVNYVESGIICRLLIDKIIVDIMPTDDLSVGFAN